MRLHPASIRCNAISAGALRTLTQRPTSVSPDQIPMFTPALSWPYALWISDTVEVIKRCGPPVGGRPDGTDSSPQSIRMPAGAMLRRRLPMGEYDGPEVNPDGQPCGAQ